MRERDGSPGVVVVIPATLSSSRLPRKMLLSETGRALVLHTCDRALESTRVDRVIVATDSDEIRRVVEDAGIESILTSGDVRTGSDRVAAAAAEVRAPYFVNLQGDEPEIDSADINRIADALRTGSGEEIVTLAQRVADADEWNDPNTVKVVFGRDGRALYFSRASIPSPKRGEPWSPEVPGWKHVGIYGFSRERLLAFRMLPPSTLEQREGLEQLRALDNGWTVRVLESRGQTLGINSPQDYSRFVSRVAEAARTARNA